MITGQALANCPKTSVTILDLAIAPSGISLEILDVQEKLELMHESIPIQLPTGPKTNAYSLQVDLRGC